MIFHSSSPFPAGWKCCDTGDVLHDAQTWGKQHVYFPGSFTLFSVFLGMFQCVVTLPSFVFRMQAAPDEVWSVLQGVSAARLRRAEPQRFLFIVWFPHQNTQDRVFLTSPPKASQSERWLSFCIADCYPRASSDCWGLLESSVSHRCLGEQSDTS